MSTILVIEDNVISRRVVRAMLERAGFTVTEAADARSALASVRAVLPDLILQDMMLPDHDGVELTHFIREIPGCMDIPIIILTGIANRLLDPRAIAARYASWLVKPIDAFHLIEAVRAYLPKDDAGDVGKGLHLLIVDDDPTKLKLSRLHFLQLGFDVLTARSATHALEQLRTRPVDAVLSDVLMPDVDGFEMCLEIRRNAKFAHIPVILISASYQQERDRSLAASSGANALLPSTPELDGVHKVIIRSIAEGPPVSPATVEAEQQGILQQHAQVARRQLDQQLRMNQALARRCSSQAAQLALLGGMADALSRDEDTGLVLNEVLGATLDSLAISRGLLYLMTDGKLAVACAIGYPDTQLGLLNTFFGHRPLLEEVVGSKAALKISRQSSPSSQQLEVLDRAGASSIHLVPLVDRDDALGALALISSATDVTGEEPVVFARAIGAHIIQSLQLRQAFDRVAFSDARFLGLVENSGSAILTVRLDGIIFNVNSMAETIFGRPREDLVGHTISEFFAPADRDYAMLRFKDRLAGGPTGTEVGILRPVGAPMTIALNSLMIEAGGKRVALAVANDITERNRMRQQAALNDKLTTVGTIAAGVAHEINNPIAFILNNLRQLERQFTDVRTVVERLRTLRKELDPARRLALLESLEHADLDLDGFLVDSDETVRESIQGAERIRDIVKGMKGFARVEDSEILPIDVNQAVETALNLTLQEVRQRAQLHTELASDLPSVVGSRGRLQQVIINLVVNATQAIEEGDAEGNAITIRTYHDAAWVGIEVRDSGKGIAPEHLSRLFDPFFTTKPVGVGTGLGLAICHEIVRNHGGRITVASTPGCGATFTVLLPLPPMIADPVAEPVVAVPSVGRDASTVRLLMVDDEEALLHSFRRLLRGSYQLVMAHGGREGMEAIRLASTPFDAIICDLSMPDVSGMDLHQYISEQVPGLEQRMIFMSGGAFTPRSVAFLETISNPRLQKPFSRQELDARSGDGDAAAARAAPRRDLTGGSQMLAEASSTARERKSRPGSHPKDWTCNLPGRSLAVEASPIHSRNISRTARIRRAEVGFASTPGRKDLPCPSACCSRSSSWC